MTGRARSTAVKASATKVAARKADQPATSRAAAKSTAGSRSASAKASPAKKAAPTKAPAVKKSAVKASAPSATRRSGAAAKSAAAKRPASGTAVKAPARSAAKVSPARAAAKGTDLTARDLAKIRKELMAEIEQMQAEYDSSLAELTELQSSSADGAGDDQADAGSKTFEREQELSIAANRFDLLSQMQRAVERIDSRTYGFCERCGKPIPRARLQAFPMATLDVECKQREERR
jgi:RNA polymerase-binding protein DksA